MGVAKCEVTADLIRELFHMPDTARITAIKESAVDSHGNAVQFMLYISSPDFDGLGDGMNPVQICPRYASTTTAEMVDWGLPQQKPVADHPFWQSKKAGE